MIFAEKVDNVVITVEFGHFLRMIWASDWASGSSMECPMKNRIYHNDSITEEMIQTLISMSIGRGHHMISDMQERAVVRYPLVIITRRRPASLRAWALSALPIAKSDNKHPKQGLSLIALIFERRVHLL